MIDIDQIAMKKMEHGCFGVDDLFKDVADLTHALSGDGVRSVQETLVEIASTALAWLNFLERLEQEDEYIVTG